MADAQREKAIADTHFERVDKAYESLKEERKAEKEEWKAEREAERKMWKAEREADREMEYRRWKDDRNMEYKRWEIEKQSWQSVVQQMVEKGFSPPIRSRRSSAFF